MKIKTLKAKNFRTLEDITIFFDDRINFIVGKNNIGKSNLLKLLEIISLVKNFSETDFSNSALPIEIEVTLKISNIEKGIFEDYFSPTDSNEFKVIIRQDTAFDSIEITHSESGEIIPHSWIKKINYLTYDSMRRPFAKEDYSKNSNNFNIIPFLIEKYYEEQTLSDDIFSNSLHLDEALSFVNASLGKVDTLKSNDLSLSIDSSNSIGLIKKIMTMQDEKGNDISKMGYGIQFVNMVPMCLLNEIIRLYKREKAFNNRVQIDELGKKYIEYSMGIDEPEIHLHPHLQRRLIKYLKKIFSGKDENFNSLIKDLFGLDYIKGQLFIVTHSPLMVLGNYKQIIRIYNDDNQVNAISGSEIIIESKLQKHLEKNIDELKKAFFSKVIVFVEGDSEVLAMQKIAEREGIDLDEWEIEVVSSGSVRTIPLLAELFNKFSIKNVSIIDKDDDNDSNPLYTNVENIFITSERDFEYEMFNEISITNFVKYIEELNINDPKAPSFIIKYLNSEMKSKLDLKSRPLSVELEKLTVEDLAAIKELSKNECISLMKSQKSVLSGKLISELLNNTPLTYKKALNKARALSNGK